MKSKYYNYYTCIFNRLYIHTYIVTYAHTHSILGRSENGEWVTENVSPEPSTEAGSKPEEEEEEKEEEGKHFYWVHV